MTKDEQAEGFAVHMTAAHLKGSERFSGTGILRGVKTEICIRLRFS